MDESLHDMDNAGYVVVVDSDDYDVDSGNVVAWTGSDVLRFPDVGGYDKMEPAFAGYG